MVPVIAIIFTGCGNSGANQSTPASSPGLVEKGAVLYQANCLSCHGGSTGGNLRDIPPPHNANGHTWHHPDQQLIDIVLNGLSFSVEGQQKMPAFKDKLTEEDVKAILAYIKTWWTPKQRAWQATVTAQSGQ